MVNNHLRGEKGLINAGYIQNTDTHTYTHTHTHTDIHTDIHTDTHTHRHTHVYTVIPLLIFVVNNHLRGEKGLINAGYIQNTDTHTYTHTHTHTDIHTDIHTDTHTHRHTHVYTVIPLLIFVVNNHLRGEKGLINAGYIQNTDTHTYTQTHTRLYSHPTPDLCG